MKKLHNQTLNKIYNDFMEKKDFDQKKKPNKIVKYVPILNFFKFIHFDNSSKVSILSYALFVTMGSFPLLVHNSVNNVGNYYIMIAIFLLILYTLDVLNYDTIMKEKDELEEKEEGNVALSVEDFNTIISTFNKAIVSKLISGNNGTIKYNNLEELDRLLLNEEYILNEIYNKKIDEVLEKIDLNIDREKLVIILKNKGLEEMISTLKSDGLKFKDLEPLIQEDMFWTKIVESYKKEDVLN